MLKVDDVKVVVYGADGKKVSSKSGPLGSALLKGSLLGTGASLEVSFTPQLDGAPAKPQQAMLMGASKAYPGLAVYAVAKPQKDGSHVATLSSASIDKQVANMVRGHGLLARCARTTRGGALRLRSSVVSRLHG